jgi:chromosome segregation ATPase
MGDPTPAPPSIPVPPALDRTADPGTPPRATSASEHDGLLGARRWRQRYDAIRAYLDELESVEPVPPEIVHAMAAAETALDELEDAVQTAQTYQEAVEAIHERARDIRGTLGRAIDQTAAGLSDERGVFEALATRRNSLRTQRESARIKVRRGVGSEGEADALLWELAAVEEELRTAGQKCDELEAQVAELTAEHERRNEPLELERAQLVRVLDAQMLRLEGIASALRKPLELAEHHVRARWPSTPAEGVFP